MIFLGIIGLVLYSSQSFSWKNTIGSNKTIVAGQMIERQIEAIRIAIDRNPAYFFPPPSFQKSENGIDLKWTISQAVRPVGGANLSNVRKCYFVASWGKGKNDSLKVTTYLSKMF